MQMKNFGFWAAILVFCVTSFHQNQGASVRTNGIKAATSGQKKLDGSRTNHDVNHEKTFEGGSSISESSSHNVTTEHIHLKLDQPKTSVTIGNPHHELTFNKSHSENSHAKEKKRYKEESGRQYQQDVLNASDYNSYTAENDFQAKIAQHTTGTAVNVNSGLLNNLKQNNGSWISELTHDYAMARNDKEVGLSSNEIKQETVNSYTNQTANVGMNNGNFTPQVEEEIHLGKGTTDDTIGLPTTTRRSLENLKKIAQLIKVIEVVSKATPDDDGTSITNGQNSNNSKQLSTSSSQNSSLAVGGSLKLDGAAEYNRLPIVTDSSSQNSSVWKENNFETPTESNIKPSNGEGVKMAVSATNNYIPSYIIESGGNLNIVGSQGQYTDLNHQQSQPPFTDQNFQPAKMTESTTSTHYNKNLTTIHESINKAKIVTEHYNTLIPIAQQGVSSNMGNEINPELSIHIAGDIETNQQQNILTANSQSNTTSNLSTPKAEGAMNLHAAASNVQNQHSTNTQTISTSSNTTNSIGPQIKGTVNINADVGSNQKQPKQAVQGSVTASNEQQNPPLVTPESHENTTSNVLNRNTTETHTLATSSNTTNSIGPLMKGTVNLNADVGSKHKQPIQVLHGSVTASSELQSPPLVTSESHANTTSNVLNRNTTETHTLATSSNTTNSIGPLMKGTVNLNADVGSNQKQPSTAVQASVKASSELQSSPLVTSGSHASAASNAQNKYTTDTQTKDTYSTTTNSIEPLMKDTVNLNADVGSNQKQPSTAVQASVTASSELHSSPLVTSGSHASAASNAQNKYTTDTQTKDTYSTTTNSIEPLMKGTVNLKADVGSKKKQPSTAVQGSVTASSKTQTLPLVPSGSHASATSNAQNKYTTDTQTKDTYSTTTNSIEPLMKGTVNLKADVGSKKKQPSTAVQGSVTASSKTQTLPLVPSGSHASATSNAQSQHSTNTQTINTYSTTTNSIEPLKNSTVNLKANVGSIKKQPSTALQGSVTASSEQQSPPLVPSGSHASATSNAQNQYTTDIQTINTYSTTTNSIEPLVNSTVNLKADVGSIKKQPSTALQGSVTASSETQTLPLVPSGSHASATSNAQNKYTTDTQTINTYSTTTNSIEPLINSTVNLKADVGSIKKQPSTAVQGSVTASSEQQSPPIVPSGSHASATSNAQNKYTTDTQTKDTYSTTTNSIEPLVNSTVNLKADVGSIKKQPSTALQGSVTASSETQTLPLVPSGSHASATSNAQNKYTTDTQTKDTYSTTTNSIEPLMKGTVNLNADVGSKHKQPSMAVQGSVTASSETQTLPLVPSRSHASATSNAQSQHSTNTQTINTYSTTTNSIEPLINSTVNLKADVGSIKKQPSTALQGSVTASSETQTLPLVPSGSHASATSNAQNKYTTDTQTINTYSTTTNSIEPLINSTVNLKADVGSIKKQPSTAVQGSVTASSEQQSPPIVPSRSHASATSNAQNKYTTDTQTKDTYSTTTNSIEPLMNGRVNLNADVGSKHKQPSTAVQGSVTASSETQTLPLVPSGSHASATSNAQNKYTTDTQTKDTYSTTTNSIELLMKGTVNLKADVGSKKKQPSTAVQGSVTASSETQTLPLVTSGSHASATSNAQGQHSTNTQTINTYSTTTNSIEPLKNSTVNLKADVGSIKKQPSTALQGSVTASSETQTLPLVPSGSHASATSNAQNKYTTDTQTIDTYLTTNNSIESLMNSTGNLNADVGSNKKQPSTGVQGSVTASIEQQSPPIVPSGSHASATSNAQNKYTTDTQTKDTYSTTTNSIEPLMKGTVNFKADVGSKQKQPSTAVQGSVTASNETQTLPLVPSGSHATATSNAQNKYTTDTQTKDTYSTTTNSIEPLINSTVNLKADVGSIKKQPSTGVQGSATASSEQQSPPLVPSGNYASTTSNIQNRNTTDSYKLATYTNITNSIGLLMNSTVNLNADVGSNQKQPKQAVHGSVTASSEQQSPPLVTSGSHASATSNAQNKYTTDTQTKDTYSTTTNSIEPLMKGTVNFKADVGSKQKQPSTAVQGSVTASNETQTLPLVPSGSHATATSNAQNKYTTDTQTKDTYSTTTNSIEPLINSTVNLNADVGSNQKQPKQAVHGSVTASSEQQSPPLVTSGSYASTTSNIPNRNTTNSHKLATYSNITNSILPLMKGTVNLNADVGSNQKQPKQALHGSVTASSEQQSPPIVLSGSHASATSKAQNQSKTDSHKLATYSNITNSILPLMKGTVNLNADVGSNQKQPKQALHGSVTASSEQQSPPIVLSGSHASATSKAQNQSKTDSHKLATYSNINNSIGLLMNSSVNLNADVGRNQKQPSQAVQGSVTASSEQQSPPLVKSGSYASATSNAQNQHTTNSQTLATSSNTTNSIGPLMKSIVNLNADVGSNQKQQTHAVQGSVTASSELQSSPLITSGSYACTTSNIKNRNTTDIHKLATSSNSTNSIESLMNSTVNLNADVGSNQKHKTHAVQGSVTASSEQQSPPLVKSGSYASATSNAQIPYTSDTSISSLSKSSSNSSRPVHKGTVDLHADVESDQTQPTHVAHFATSATRPEESILSHISKIINNTTSSLQSGISLNAATKTNGYVHHDTTVINNQQQPSTYGVNEITSAFGAPFEGSTTTQSANNATMLDESSIIIANGTSLNDSYEYQGSSLSNSQHSQKQISPLRVNEETVLNSNDQKTATASGAVLEGSTIFSAQSGNSSTTTENSSSNYSRSPVGMKYNPI